LTISIRKVNRAHTMVARSAYERALINKLLSVKSDAMRRAKCLREDIKKLASDEKTAFLCFKRNAADGDAEQRWWDSRRKHDLARTKFQEVNNDARMATIIIKEIRVPPNLTPSGTIYLCRPSRTADRVKIGWTAQPSDSRFRNYKSVWKTWMRLNAELPPFDATDFDCEFPGIPADERRLCSMFRGQRLPMPFRDTSIGRSKDVNLANEWFFGTSEIAEVMRANRDARLEHLNHRLIWRLEI